MAESILVGEEGEVLNSILHRRLVRNNQNCLIVTSGPTGSGKSYTQLRQAELWYKKRFNEPFPKYNICFGPKAFVKRLLSKTLPLRRGELFILEEAGTTLSALDFQSKTAKAFLRVMQVFRSKNYCVMFNLPAFDTLNKQLRGLAHISMITNGIDRKTKKANLKCYELEVAPTTGKIYTKFPIIKHNGELTRVESFNYSEPSKYLSEPYELDKDEYVNKTLEEANQVFEEEETVKKAPIQRLTPLWEDIQECRRQGITKQGDIAAALEKSQPTISVAMKRMDAKGIEPEKPLEKAKNPQNSHF